MTKRFVALLGITILLVSLRTGALAQNAIDANGSWSMTSSGEAFAKGQVKVRQDGWLSPAPMAKTDISKGSSSRAR